MADTKDFAILTMVTSGFTRALLHVRGPFVGREPSLLETAILFDLKSLQAEGAR